MPDYFDRLHRCIAGWKHTYARLERIESKAATQEWFADTIGFLEELLMLRGILDLDKSAHELDKESGRRAIEEAQHLLDSDPDLDSNPEDKEPS